MSVNGLQNDPSGLSAGHKHGSSTPFSKSVISFGMSVDPYGDCKMLGLLGLLGLLGPERLKMGTTEAFDFTGELLLSDPLFKESC
jgi:hypothetical protein